MLRGHKFDSRNPTKWTNFPELSSAAVRSSTMSVPVVVHNDLPIAGNVALQTYAGTYFDDFVRLFEITGNGTLRATARRLQEVEDWFNRSYVLISLITGIPLQPIRFLSPTAPDIGERTQRLNSNKMVMLHVYAVSYATLLRMATTLGRPVPPQYIPNPNVLVEVLEEDDA